MGLVRAQIEIVNASDIALFEVGNITEQQIRKLTTSALADTGAVMMAINESIKTQLGLRVRDKRSVQLADGTVKELEVVGPVEIHFENRMSTTNAIVLPGDAEVLLGAIPMEEMDVLVHPAEQKLIVNPLHPIKPQMIMK